VFTADFKFEEFSTDITRALVAMRDVSFHIESPCTSHVNTVLWQVSVCLSIHHTCAMCYTSFYL